MKKSENAREREREREERERERERWGPHHKRIRDVCMAA